MIEKTVQTLTDNIENLRKFADLLHDYLKEKQKDLLITKSEDLMILVDLFDKMGVYEENKQKEERDFKGIIAEEDILLSAHTTNSGNNIVISITGDPNNNVVRSFSDLALIRRHIVLLYKSSLMNLIGIIEVFFSNFIHDYYENSPGAIPSKDKVFSFDDLSSFNTIQEARQYYTNSKVEGILHGSFSDWLEFLRNQLKLSMAYINEDLDLMIETFLRRNLVVHNDGLVNVTYILKAPKSLLGGVQIGEKLPIDWEYLSKRIDIFEKNCILMALEYWKKIRPADENRAELVSDIIYKNLVEKRWDIAESLCFFTIQDKQIQEKYLIIAKLNYWLCKKRTGKWNDISKDILQTDFSAKGLRYQLGFLSLKNDKDGFFDILPRALASEEIDKEALNTFPIFEEIRGDDRFEEYRMIDQIALEAMSEALNDDPQMKEEVLDQIIENLSKIDKDSDQTN